MREKIDREQADLEINKLAANNARPATREIAKNRPGVDNDRGRARNNVERQKPAARMSDRQMQDRQMPDRKVENRKQNAFQGARDNGNRERAASQRGKASVQRQGGNRAGGRKR